MNHLEHLEITQEEADSINGGVIIVDISIV